MVLFHGKPYIIEVAGRLSGGYFCSHMIAENTGVDLVGNAIKLAIDDKIDCTELSPNANVFVVQRYIFPAPGRVEQIEIPSWIEQDKNIKLFEIRVNVNDVVAKTVHHPARAGVVITIGKSRDLAISLAEKVVNSVKIITNKT